MRTLSTVRIVTALGWFVVLVLTLAVVATPVLAGTLRCPPDSVKVGPTCVDKYEASPTPSSSLVELGFRCAR